MMSMLPDAIEREREALLEASMRILSQQGFERFEARELPGYDDPEPLAIPVLNIHLTPDLRAVHASGDLILGVVEPESDLGEEACGRRWQGLMAWAERHDARFNVFVHQENRVRAQDIARHWHLAETIIQPVPRH
jgi:hypothetical protein